ncbi:TetR family transcriptional regulator [uncultured Agrococcus sp.]|uniref:TetR family transcriptional regulator n=1 Tax=uncultured Agrococcus sp. TaxID=382258 RepID=UPI0025F850A2|nr:TetR family transcriptional regulator [uncultured Agrococcus sp.]
MPRASAADAAKTARSILEAATRLFATHGFADVSLDDIAREAGVTRGAVYHHYRNKAGLFERVAAKQQEEVAGAVVEAAERAGSGAIDQLRAGSHAFLDAATAGAAARILLIDGPAVIGWEGWRRHDAEHSALHLRDVLKAVGVRKELLEAMTALLSGAMNEAALWIAQHAAGEEARRSAHATLDRILDAAIAGAD